MSLEWPYLSASSYATPRSITEDRQGGLRPSAKLHVTFPHGKGMRTVVVRLGRHELLAMIANAADALRLLDDAEPVSSPAVCPERG